MDYQGTVSFKVYRYNCALLVIAEMMAKLLQVVRSAVRIGTKILAMSTTGVGALVSLFLALNLSWSLCRAAVNSTMLVIAIIYYKKYRQFRMARFIGTYLIKKV